MLQKMGFMAWGMQATTYSEDKEQKWNLLDSSTSFPSKVREGGGMKDWNLIVRFAIPQNLLLLLSVTCPVMYSCNSILEEKAVSPSDFTFASLWSLSYMTHPVLVLALISLCQTNAHFLCLLS